MSLAWECAEVRHIAGYDDAGFLTRVGEDVRFVIGTLSERVSNVDCIQIFFGEIRGYFRVDVLVEEKLPRGPLRPCPD